MIIPGHRLQAPFEHPYIPRERLRNLFRSCDPAKLIVVEAPAGYGKSIAVDDFTRHILAPVAWYPLEWLYEPNALYFVWNLVQAIQSSSPEFGMQTHLLLQEAITNETLSSQDSWLSTSILPNLLKELATVDGPLWVVLENYHLVNDHPEIRQITLHLIEDTLTKIRFIITLRPLSEKSFTPPWSGQSSMATISAAELAFTLTESQALARKLGLRLNHVQLEKITEKTAGWPLTQNWLYQLCRGKGTEEISRLLDGSLNYETVAEEFLQQQSSILRDFLCKTSLLVELTPSICNALLEIDDADALLERLRDSSFLHRLEGKVFKHSHENVREFLQQALWHGYGEAEVKYLYNRLAQIYEQQGEWDHAIVHYQSSQQFSEINRLITTQAESLIGSAQINRLANWLSHLPESWIEKTPSLLIYKGLVLANEQNLLAEDYFIRAQRLSEEQGDTLITVRAKIELSWSYFLRGNLNRAAEILQEILAKPELSPQLRAKHLHYLAVVTYYLDHFEEALKFAEEASLLLRQIGTTEAKAELARLLRHLSTNYQILWRHQEAIKTLKEARRLTEALNLGGWSLAWIDNLLAEFHRRLGRFQEAHTYLDQADAFLNPYRELGVHSPLFDYVLITRGHLYRGEYDYNRAESLYRQAGRGHPNGVFLALRLEQQDQTQTALEMAQGNWSSKQSLDSIVTRAMYQAMLGLAYLNTGHHQLTKDYLESAAETFANHGAIYQLVVTRMYLAKSYFVLNQQPQGITCLHYVFSQMAQTHCYNLDWWQPWVVAEMCAVALREQIEPDFVEQLVYKRLAAAYLTPFLPLINDAHEVVRVQATRILHHFGEQTRLYARQLLNECPEQLTRARLLAWLDSGWLTEIGLITLKQMLSWRQIEIFLLWICPRLQGSIDQIAKEAILESDTVNTYLKSIRISMQEKGKLSLPRGKGAHAPAYDWAIRHQFINPHSTLSC